tara:strand:+ start:2491 stop:3171 length:681 start_codon:yes stop_codon:yes gene_type:complete
MTILELSQLEIRYPHDEFHLNVPSLQVESKEKVALIGPSGSGKTSLMNVIAGIMLPEAGDVYFDGVKVNALSDRERRQFRLSRIGFIFQDFGLINYLSALDNILHTYRINPALQLKKSVIERAHSLADSLGVSSLLHKFPHTLSQGEKQRLAICRALLTQPQLILADEATGNLDPANKNKILEKLFSAVDEHNATLVVVTHDHALLSHFDRTIHMDDLTGRAQSHA